MAVVKLADICQKSEAVQRHEVEKRPIEQKALLL